MKANEEEIDNEEKISALSEALFKDFYIGKIEKN